MISTARDPRRLPEREPFAPTDRGAVGVDYFGRGHWLTSAQERLAFRARRRMFDVWKRTVGGSQRGKTLLDVGTTPDGERLDSKCFLPWFHEEGLQITVYSPENIDHLAGVFPYLLIWPSVTCARPGAPYSVRLPMQDASYDWVVSSAVLEHVGHEDRQLEFIKESGRVGRNVFLTTPDRRHWLEFHTKLPFLHWLPKGCHRALLALLGKPFWAREQNLNLLTKTRLRRLAADALGDRFDITVRGICTLGMSSNVVLIARRRQDLSGR